MQLTTIEVDQAMQETTEHGTYAFPMQVYTDVMDEYDSGFIRWHWHREFEFVVLVEGAVDFYMGDRRELLQKGQGAFINANVRHMMKPAQPGSEMFSVLFRPALLGSTGQSVIGKKYVTPLVGRAGLEYLVFNEGSGWQQRVLEYLNGIYSAECRQDFGFELEMRNLVGQMWLEIVRSSLTKAQAEEDAQRTASAADEQRIKDMLECIHARYAEKLSLEEIAGAAGLSRSECCRCFGRALGMTPFSYLIQYRIGMAAQLLLETHHPVIEIAHSTGFENVSYFGKLFREQTRCTPTEYRHKMRGRG